MCMCFCVRICTCISAPTLPNSLHTPIQKHMHVHSPTTHTCHTRTHLTHLSSFLPSPFHSLTHSLSYTHTYSNGGTSRGLASAGLHNTTADSAAEMDVSLVPGSASNRLPGSSVGKRRRDVDNWEDPPRDLGLDMSISPH